MTAVLDRPAALTVRDEDGNHPRCKFLRYPNADEVIDCDNPAAYLLTGPCCKAVTPICQGCLDILPGTSFWQCNSCGTRTNAPCTLKAHRI